MGIVEGAIIGGIVGAAVAGLALAKHAGGRRRVVAAMAKDDVAAARAAIEKVWPNRGKLGMQQIMPLLGRYTALGALGDLERIREEVAALPAGSLTARVQVRMHALLVRRLLGDTSREILSEMEALADEVTREGGALLTLVKRQAQARLALARTVDGMPLADEHRKVAQSAIRQGDLTKPVYQLGLMYDRVARGETQGIAEVILDIEREWPHSAYARQAERILSGAGVGART